MKEDTVDNVVHGSEQQRDIGQYPQQRWSRPAGQVIWRLKTRVCQAIIPLWSFIAHSYLETRKRVID